MFPRTTNHEPRTGRAFSRGGFCLAAVLAAATGLVWAAEPRGPKKKEGQPAGGAERPKGDGAAAAEPGGFWKDSAGWKTYEVTALLSAGPGSLGEAIAKANADGTPSRIVFKAGGRIPCPEPLPELRSDLLIDGLSAPEPGILLDVEFAAHPGLATSGKNVAIRGLTIRHVGDQDGISFWGARDAWVDRCTFVNNYDEGIGITDGTRNVIVSNSRFEGNGTPPKNGRALLVSQGSSAVVVNSFFRSGLRGVNANTDKSFLDIRNCVAENNMEYGVAIAQGSGNVIDCILRENPENLRIKGSRVHVAGTKGVAKPTSSAPESAEDTPFPAWLELRTPDRPESAGAPRIPPGVTFQSSHAGFLAWRPPFCRSERPVK